MTRDTGMAGNFFSSSEYARARVVIQLVSVNGIVRTEPPARFNLRQWAAENRTAK